MFTLGTVKSPVWKKEVSRMVDSFQKLKCSMSLTLHFMDSHVEYLSEHFEDCSEEQGERFHQDIKVMEQRYQGRWDENMMADDCWMLKRDASQKESMKRKMLVQRSFECKRVRYNEKIAVFSLTETTIELIIVTIRI